MSGQPSKTQSDINKFKNEYMETLKLQEKLNDMNLQANKTYLLTGQLPPQSQLQDTRTTAEKLADVEKMKQEIAGNLKDIAEPTFAYQIVNKVMESPLNINNSLLRFLAQRAPSIAAELKKSYSYGIVGDNNDLELIVNFIKNMYSEQQGKFQSTKTYLNSIGNPTSYSRVLSGNDIDNISRGLEDINKNIILVSESIKLNNQDKKMIFNTRKLCHEISIIILNLKKNLPTTEEISLLLDDVSKIKYNNPYQSTSDEYELEPTLEEQPSYNSAQLQSFYNFIEKLPRYTEVMAIITKIKQFIMSSNYNLVMDGLKKLQNMFSAVENIGGIFTHFKKIKERQQFKINQAQKLEANQTREFIDNQSKQARDISKANKVYVINSEEHPVNINQVNQENIKSEVDANNHQKVINQGDINIPQGAINQIQGIPNTKITENQKYKNTEIDLLIKQLSENELDELIKSIRLEYIDLDLNTDFGNNLLSKKKKNL